MGIEKKDEALPPRPGEKIKEEVKRKIDGTPFVIYMNGNPIELCKKEALSVMAQIVSIMMYLDEQPK